MSTLKRYNGTNWETIGGSITGDTLPIGSEIDYTGSSVPAGWEEVADYSTSEVDTGKTWINGEKIYRKVYTGTITSVSGLEIGSISNFGNLVHLEGWSNQNGYITSLLQYWNDTLKCILQVGYQNGKVYLNAGASFLDADYTIIMEYTKTTD